MFDLPGKQRRLGELEQQLGAPGAWDDPNHAGGLARESSELRDEIESIERLERRARDLVELSDLAADDAVLEAQVSTDLRALERDLEQRELELLFNEPYSDHNAILSISAGAGGIDAQDWVEMLLRMYSKWAQPGPAQVSVLRPGCEVELLEATPGDEAGLKGATLILRGRRAYGLLRAEHGVHRLVRISPFDQNHRRHTSFALVEVMPELEAGEEEEVEINPDDLRIDTYRSTGAGGQHVNKTDSAVRLTHLPTGIVVTSQNERSQMKNRESAMKVLKSRLFQRQREEAARRREELRGDVMPAEFGSQIRNYVLQPYTLVKDVRTGVEVGNVQAVLEGEIEPFLEGWLRWRLTQREEATASS
ncbi:MAG TPA: peptide chain release factor 2 [Candidatus Dormibacteraeota bacterium]